MERDDNIYQEAAALWQAVFGEVPPVKADGATLLDIIVSRGSAPAAYERLTSPFLRAATVTEPGQAAHRTAS